ncbi:hypothetical protein [Marivita hallyeonensis]|uniref:Uncharacterized protein n=1 Tax=Marivita hallyeonensis TaxID=996342 RepID=A0A1M5M992_9RHOB|nr:hypothetical protein [Marivita hallyeonensis]SHG73801.1 hypothetical protein SAMN05443551_0435 [Marivita hallyeonensis]
MNLLWHVRSFIGLGAVFAALSELWFYPVADVAQLAVMVGFYAIAAHLSVLTVAVLGGGGALAWYLAAVLVGVLVEGIPVFELFSALPFSLLWTSIAWHGLVSGLIGVRLYRWALARGAVAFVAMNIVFGAALGIWGAYFWTAEPVGMRYAEQLPWAWGLFFAGHVILPEGRVPRRMAWPVLWMLAGLVAFGFVAGTVVAVGLLAVLLPLLCALTLLAVRGVQSEAPLWPEFRVTQAWAAGLMPLSAFALYTLCANQPWVGEVNWIALVMLAPVSLGLLVLCGGRAVTRGQSGG